MATAVGVVGIVAVGIRVGVLVGVDVADAWLLHPTSDPKAAARRLAVSVNSVKESAPGGLRLAGVCGLSNLYSSSGIEERIPQSQGFVKTDLDRF